MTDAEFIIKIVRDISKQAAKSVEASFVVGKVTGVNPLKVRIGDSYEIDEDFMFVGSLCRRNVIKNPTNESVSHLHKIEATTKSAMTGISCSKGTITDTGHTHDIKIETKTALPQMLLWRGVRVGDTVIAMRVQGSSMHYIFDRIGGLSNDGNEVDENGAVNDPEKEEQL